MESISDGIGKLGHIDLGKLVSNVDQLVTTLDTKVSEFDLKGISDQATNTLSDIDGLVSDEKLKIAIANVADASAELKDLVAAVDNDEVGLAVTNAGAAIEQIKLAAGNLAEITTPDAAIEGVFADLVVPKGILSGKVVFHCSGALSSGILPILRSNEARSSPSTYSIDR